VNGPTDLSGGTGGRRDDDSGHLGADGRDVTRALRAALGAPQDDDEAEAPGGSAGARPAAGRPAARPVPASFLAAVERRAARLHRRRQAGALAGAAAAVAVVVALGGLVLPQLGSMAESSSAGSAAGGSAESAATAPSGPAADLQDEGTGGAGPQTFADSGGESRQGTTAAAAPPSAALLTAADVTAFSVPVQDAGTSDETGQQLPLTACVEGDAGVVQPLALRRTDLTADPASLPAAAEPPGLVERVATLGSAAEGPEALARVEAQLPACTGPGLEGTGPTTQLDATPVTPVGGEALVLASTSGQGSPTLQVLLVHGSTLVQLQVTSDAPDAQTALDQLVDTARTALERATGSTSTIPARAP